MKIGQILKQALLIPNGSVKELWCIRYKDRWFEETAQGIRFLTIVAHLYDYDGELVIQFLEKWAYLCEPHTKRDFDRDETRIGDVWYFYNDEGDTSENWTELETYAFPVDMEKAELALEEYRVNMGLKVSEDYGRNVLNVSPEVSTYSIDVRKDIAKSIEGMDSDALCKLIIGGGL